MVHIVSSLKLVRRLACIFCTMEGVDAVGDGRQQTVALRVLLERRETFTEPPGQVGPLVGAGGAHLESHPWVGAEVAEHRLRDGTLARLRPRFRRGPEGEGHDRGCRGLIVVRGGGEKVARGVDLIQAAGREQVDLLAGRA